MKEKKKEGEVVANFNNLTCRDREQRWSCDWKGPAFGELRSQRKYAER